MSLRTRSKLNGSPVCSAGTFSNAAVSGAAARVTATVYVFFVPSSAVTRTASGLAPTASGMAALTAVPDATAASDAAAPASSVAPACAAVAVNRACVVPCGTCAA